MVCGVAAGAWLSTRSWMSRTEPLPHPGLTRRDWFDRISRTRLLSTTGRMSLAGVSSGPQPSSRAEWADSASWACLHPTGGSHASSSTATEGGRESRRPRWPAPFASSPPKAVGRSMDIQLPLEGSPTRAHSCSVELNQCSPRPDSARSALWVQARWLCDEWFAVDDVIQPAFGVEASGYGSKETNR